MSYSLCAQSDIAKTIPNIKNSTIHKSYKKKLRRSQSSRLKEVQTSKDIDKNLPLPEGSMGIPFLGESQEFLNSPTFLEDRIRKHGNIFKSCIFNTPTIFINGYDLIKLIIDDMTKIKSEAVETTRRLLGKGALMAIDGSHHAKLRKSVLAAFSPRSSLAYLPIIVKFCKSYIEDWCSVDEIKFIDQSKELSLRISAETVLGLAFENVSKTELLSYHDDWWDGMFTYPIDLPFTPFRKGINARENLLKIIQDAIDFIKSNPENNSDTALSKMITAMELDEDDAKKIDNDDIKDSFLNMLVASSTTAPTMAAFLLEINERPNELQKIREEQDKIISEFGPEITKESIQEMKYLEATLKEALRLRPVVPVVTRRVIREFELGGYRIPKGWQLMLGTGISTKYLDKRWPWDEDFRPERFLTGEGMKFSPEFMAFGSGPHVCLGGAIGMLIMKVLFSMIIRDYDWKIYNPYCGWQVQPLPEPRDKMPMSIKQKSK